MEVLFTPEGLLSLLMLATLEIVLGVDNLVFISIAVSRLPVEQRSKARKFGLALACVTRLALLMSLAWLALGRRHRPVGARPGPDRWRPVPADQGHDGNPRGGRRRQ